MKKTFKSISLIIGLFGISIGQSILPPTFSEDSLKFSANVDRDRESLLSFDLFYLSGNFQLENVI